MAEDTKTQLDTKKTEEKTETTPKDNSLVSDKPKRRPARRGGFGGRKRFERQKPEFDQKILSIRRVTRVVAGGRRFSFSVSMVIGDRKGSVGVGVGKASDTALAIEKSVRNAKKNMIKINHTKDMSISRGVEAKEGSAHLKIFPAPGRGIVAGSSVRFILDLAGMKDVGAKIISRSKNKLNIARATIKALKKLE